MEENQGPAGRVCSKCGDAPAGPGGILCPPCLERIQDRPMSYYYAAVSTSES
jgi:hypothetical protein